MNPVVDIHSHFYPDNIPDLSARFGGDWPGFRHTEPGKGMITLGNKDYRPVYEACWNPALRLEEMDRNGIDIQIMCATPLLFAYEKPAHQALECARLFNDMALDICEYNSDRLKALCQVPLQDIDASCKEVSRAMEAGHLGVQIGNHVGPRNLDDEGLITFLQHCAAERAPVLVHPWDMMSPERMPKYMLQWLVAMPAETQLSILSLILSGAFERLPDTLRICFAHGGGSFAFLLGRVENAWNNRDIVREDCPYPPSYYTNRFFTDSVVFDEKALDLLVCVMGEDRVMLGSDYPFPLGEQKIGSLIKNSSAFSVGTKSRLSGANAVEFFNLRNRQSTT